jgi:hypothetical protein
MIERALDAGTPARWVAGDEVYGDNPHLQTALEHRRTGYVPPSPAPTPSSRTPGKFQAKSLATRTPKQAWQRLSVGAGVQGERYYDWPRTCLFDQRVPRGECWLVCCDDG